MKLDSRTKLFCCISLPDYLHLNINLHFYRYTLITSHILFYDITEEKKYPLSFIQNQIRKFLNNKHQFNLNNIFDYQPCSYQRCIFFNLSYIGSTLLHVEKELRSFFQRKLQNQIKFVFIHNTLKLGNIFFSQRQTSQSTLE